MDTQLIKKVADIVLTNLPDSNVEYLSEEERKNYNITLNGISRIKAKEVLSDKDLFLYGIYLDTLKNFSKIEDKEVMRERFDTGINIAVAVAGLTATAALPGSGALVGQIAGMIGEFAKTTY